jgi:hypothetical protein
LLAGLVIAAGLLLLKRWAWVATILWAGTVIAFQLIAYAGREDVSYPMLAMSVAQVFYLTLPEVQRACGRHDMAYEEIRG